MGLVLVVGALRRISVDLILSLSKDEVVAQLYQIDLVVRQAHHEVD
tara:strand:+ start:12098 stop:12235 length:138 start_codon:yes stop_codon:yes gene_type:complete